MSARVEKMTEGTFRAVCKADACRAANRQRTYWRSGHLIEYDAEIAAARHNQGRHSVDGFVEHALHQRPQSGFDVDGNRIGGYE